MMGKALSYIGTGTTGHDTFPPTNSNQGSDDVFVNGVGVHRVGDTAILHCDLKKPYPCHIPVASKGSSSVFINGNAAMRIADDYDCGDVVAAGSKNVFCG